MILGIDIGGSSIKAGLIENNNLIEKLIVHTPKTRKEFLEKLCFVIGFFRDYDIRKIGIGCPGPADYKNGIILNTPNIPLNNFNLLSFLKKKFKAKEFRIDNDANCFVLGESMLSKEKVVAGFTLGTGIGGGIVISRKIFSGKGNAGELGRCIIEIDGRTGKDRIKGSLESYISAEAIRAILKKEPEEMNSAEWKRYGRLLGIGLATVNNVIDPEIIVLGGKMARSYSKFSKSMKDELKLRSINPLPEVIVGKEDSGIIGAAHLFSSI